MAIRLKTFKLIGFFLFLPLFGLNTVTIKVYNVLESFGTETQELKYSTVMNYSKRGLMTDSTIYSHEIPLSKKYVYVSGKEEGLKLQRTYEKKMVLSYHFEYDNLNRKISTTLYGENDSIYWKEFYKYDDNNFLYKQIRYNPNRALNTEMIDNTKEGQSIWAEKYSYFKEGFDHKELYNNYCLLITTYHYDSLKAPVKIKEYFDPSVIFQTIYFNNQKGNITHETTTGFLGASLGSKTYEYDDKNRKIKEVVYNQKGEVEKTYYIVFDDENDVFYDYYSDSLVNFSAIKETRLNSNGNAYVETTLNGHDNLLEKSVFYYDKNQKIIEVKKYDMVRRSISENNKVPMQIHAYEYE